MSVTITTAQVQKYNRDVRLKFQQMGSMLRDTVRVKSTNAKYEYFELLGETKAVKNLPRNSPTPLVNSQHSRRRAEMNDYDWGDLITKQDEVRTLINPEGSYVMNAVAALGRSIDEEIITAFQAAAIEGETGGTTVVFDTANWEIGGSGIPMSVDLLREAAYTMDVGKVPAAGRHILIGPKQKQQLLENTEITSSDYNTVKALVMGEINTFLGFKFHVIVDQDLLPYNSSTDRRSCYAWHERAMGLSMGMDITVDVGPRRDLRNAQQVYVAGVFGSVRIEDVVVHLDCDESP